MTDKALAYAVNLRHAETGELSVIRGTFNAYDAARIKAYLRVTSRLERTRFVAGGMRNEWRIEQDGKGGFVLPELPPELDQAEFFHCLRPIVLDEERTSFRNVAATLGKALKHEYFRWRLKNLRKQYRSERMQRLFQVYSNDVQINCEASLKAWLNGLEYHQDFEKAEAVERSSSGLPIEIQTAIYIDMLSDRALAAINLAELINQVTANRVNRDSSIPSPTVVDAEDVS
jgi:hypothetical protein